MTQVSELLPVLLTLTLTLTSTTMMLLLGLFDVDVDLFASSEYSCLLLAAAKNVKSVTFVSAFVFFGGKILTLLR